VAAWRAFGERDGRMPPWTGTEQERLLEAAKSGHSREPPDRGSGFLLALVDLYPGTQRYWVVQ
jgi:hypothetical protein